MSSQHPGASRRRRIAGERRGRALPEDQQTSLVPQAPEETKPAEPTESTEPAAEKARPTRRPVLFKERAPKPAASTTAPTTAPATADTGREPRWWGSRASLLLLSGLLALLLLLAGLTALGVLGTDSVQELNEADAVEQSTRTAPAAAEAAATAILAYDFRTLDADQDTAARFMTKEFAAEYAETFEKVVRPAAEETRAKVTASVLATSVIRATDDTALVLLFVDQATTSTANERPQIALNRVEMSMVRDGDDWRVADISSF